MISFARHPQRKPSKEKTIEQLEHDRDFNGYTEGLVVRVIEAIRDRPGASSIEIGPLVPCCSSTVRRLVHEYVERGPNSQIGITAACHGFLVRKVKKGAYWRLEVDPNRVTPAFLNPAPREDKGHLDLRPFRTIEDLSEFFKPLSLPKARTRPDLRGLGTGQDNNSSPYLRWLEDDGGEE